MTGNDRSPEKLTLTPRHLAGIAALLTSKSINDAAKAAGVGEKTLRRWLAQPEFQTALNAAAGEHMVSLMNRLQSRADRAMDVLESIAENGDKDAARVSAAGKLLEFAFRSKECLDLEALNARMEARWAALEARFGEVPDEPD